MTYTNWEAATPYQHGSEFDKSSDETSINKINPLVVGVEELNMPGTWSGAYNFTHYSDSVEETVGAEEESSPICGSARAAGDRTVDMCSDTMPRCPLNRGLIPERRFNPGMWNYYNFKSMFIKSGGRGKGEGISPLALAVIILIVAILIAISLR
jgi:hypothetical protein